MNALIETWAALAGPALVQNTIFLGLLLLALHFLRNAPAAWRHGLALLGLAKLLTPPLFVLPRLGPEPETLGFALNWLAAPASGTAAASGSGPDLVTLLFWLWLAGAAFSLCAPLAATARLARRLRDARPVDAKLLAGLGLPRGVGVFASERIGLPLTLGLFPQRIFVPADWERWSPHRRRLFLRHELAHLRRADGLLQLVELVARALWFFHPLVLLLGRRLHEYREMACDDRSLAPERESAPAYARYLAEAAESKLRTSGTIETASALLRRRRTLLKRVDYQMKGGGMLPISKWKVGGALVALLVLFLALSWALPEGDALAGKDKGEKVVKKIQADAPLKGVKVTLHGEGKMDMDGQSMDILAFNRKFMGLEGDAPVINLECKKTLPMGELFAFQQTLAERGLTKVRYLAGAEAMPYKLPDADQSKKLAAKLAELPPEHVTHLTVTAAGDRLLDGKKLPMKKIMAKLSERIEADPKLVVVIETEAKTAYGSFVDAFAGLKKIGADKIAIAPPQG